MSNYFKNLWLVATNKEAMNLVSLAKELYISAMYKEVREGSITVFKNDGSKHTAKYKVEPVYEELDQ